jgi:hypothetical protein
MSIILQKNNNFSDKLSKKYFLTIPLKVGSSNGDRLPWKSGQIWMFSVICDRVGTLFSIASSDSLSSNTVWKWSFLWNKIFYLPVNFLINQKLCISVAMVSCNSGWYIILVCIRVAMVSCNSGWYIILVCIRVTMASCNSGWYIILVCIRVTMVSCNSGWYIILVCIRVTMASYNSGWYIILVCIFVNECLCFRNF